MIMGKRKSVGVFFGGFDAVFSESLFRVIQDSLASLDADVFFFSTISYFQYRNQYDRQENRLFDFVPVEDLDGVLIVPDTYNTQGFRDELIDMLETRTRCPIVTLRNQYGPGRHVYTDEKEALRPLARHLIEEHHLTRIGFVSGYVEHADSQTRLACFRDEMERHGLTVPDEMVYRGDMWVTTGPGAYRYFFEDTDLRPEALVCANDYMAKGIMDELSAHGLRVPEDVIVTGFDNVTTLGSITTLTTIAQDYDEIIRRAVLQLWDRMEHAPSERGEGDDLVPGRLVLGQSCGCTVPGVEKLNQNLVQIGRSLDRERDQSINLTYLDIELSSCNRLSDLHEALSLQLTAVPDQRDFYICLFHRLRGSGAEFAEEITDGACLVSAFENHRDAGMPMILFDSRKLLPEEFRTPAEPRIFYLSILHQQDRIYGYTLLCLKPDGSPSAFFQHRNVMISGALRNIFTQQKLTRLYEERAVLSRYDPLTQVMNRRGFDEELSTRWDAMCGRGETAAFLSLDMDHLKELNDSYGHHIGDRALILVGRACLASFSEDAIIARIGGDEFLVFLPDCGEDDVREKVRVLEENLTRLSRENGMPRDISCSVGAGVIRLEKDMQPEQCIRVSDRMMYEEKARHHAARG